MYLLCVSINLRKNIMKICSTWTCKHQWQLHSYISVQWNDSKVALMSYHGRLGERQYIYMIKETNELALNVSLVVSIMIHHNWHCLSMSCRIKYIKAMKEAMAARFPHRSERWVEINRTILENWKRFFTSSLKVNFRGKCTTLPALKFHDIYFKQSLVIRFT